MNLFGGGGVLFAHLETRCVNLRTSLQVWWRTMGISVLWWATCCVTKNDRVEEGLLLYLSNAGIPLQEYSCDISVLYILIRPRGLPIDYLLQDKLSAMVLRFLVVNAPINSWLANMYTVQICTKSSICGTRWTGVKGRTSSFQINLKSPITYRPLLNYAINILKDGPPSCDVINTFRINVNFSTRIFTLFDAIYLYMYLFTYFSKILSRMNHL